MVECSVIAGISWGIVFGVSEMDVDIKNKDGYRFQVEFIRERFG